MDKKEFKKTLTDILSEYGFSYKNNIYRNVTNDLIIVIATQKSNFENIYYINYGFSIKLLHPDIEKVKDNTSDVFGRFVFNFSRKKTDKVEYTEITSERFSSELKRAIEHDIQPVLKYGLVKYFELYPFAKNMIPSEAKKLLFD